GDTREAKLTVLAEQVRNHLDTEDSVLLTAIEDLVDDDTLLELGRRMEQRERVIEARRELAATILPGGARGRRGAPAAPLPGVPPPPGPYTTARRSGRAAEGSDLESRRTREGPVGSNPTSSALGRPVVLASSGET